MFDGEHRTMKAPAVGENMFLAGRLATGPEPDWRGKGEGGE